MLLTHPLYSCLEPGVPPAPSTPQRVWRGEPGRTGVGRQRLLSKAWHLPRWTLRPSLHLLCSSGWHFRGCPGSGGRASCLLKSRPESSHFPQMPAHPLAGSPSGLVRPTKQGRGLPQGGPRAGASAGPRLRAGKQVLSPRFHCDGQQPGSEKQSFLLWASGRSWV